MRIEWNSDAIESIIRRLANAEDELNVCKVDADRVREALNEANPQMDDKRLNSIAAQFETAAEQLERLKKELNETIRNARLADERFREAEQRNLRLVEKLEDTKTGNNSFATAAKRMPVRATAPVRHWTVPKPRVMPGGYNAWRIATPIWLAQLLKEFDFNARI